MSAEWKQDFAVMHKWQERHVLDCGSLVLVVERDYSDHALFCCKVHGRWCRMLKRKFQDIIEAKLATRALALKIVREIQNRLEA